MPPSNAIIIKIAMGEYRKLAMENANTMINNTGGDRSSPFHLEYKEIFFCWSLFFNVSLFSSSPAICQ